MVDPNVNISATLNSMVDQFVWGDAPASFVIKDLTPTTVYSIQIFVLSESLGPHTFENGGATVGPYSTHTSGTPAAGFALTGTWVADAATQTFTQTVGSSVPFINAVQVWEATGVSTGTPGTLIYGK